MKAEHAMEQDNLGGLSDAAAQQAGKSAAQAAMKRDDERFDWNMGTNEDVLCPEQRAIAIYQNPHGQAVIRQERAWDEEEDPFICISRELIPSVIEKLRKICDEG